MRGRRGGGWRWGGARGAVRQRKRPREPHRDARGWAPAALVLGVAVVGALSLAGAYRRPKATPPPVATSGVVLQVAVFDETGGLERFLEGFLPWALDRGASSGEWGGGGPRVEVVEHPGPPPTWAVNWGPFPVAEAGRRLSEVQIRWGLEADVAT